MLWCGLPKPVDLFWLKVEKSAGCWHYRARLDELGYGRFARKGPLVFAHRCAWIFTYGPIPDDMDVCHTCDVRNCCNPDHLFVGTAEENMRDCVAKGRNARGARTSNKLTEEQAAYIKANWRKTGPRRGNGSELARQFGVDPGTVNSIGSGRTWKHLK